MNRPNYGQLKSNNRGLPVNIIDSDATPAEIPLKQSGRALIGDVSEYNQRIGGEATGGSWPVNVEGTFTGWAYAIYRARMASATREGIAGSFFAMTEGGDEDAIGTTHFAISKERAIAASAMNPGQRYFIQTLGTTDWNVAAGTSAIVYTVGQIFTCAVVGTGTGTVTPYLSAFALYADAGKWYLDSSTATGLEVNAFNLPGPSPMADSGLGFFDRGFTPYKAPLPGHVAVLRAKGGSDASILGRTYAVDALLDLDQNGAAAWVGVCFGFDSLMREGMADDTTEPPNSGLARAIDMAYQHMLVWRAQQSATPGDGLQPVAARIYSEITSTTVQLEMVFTDGGIAFNERIGSGGALFQIVNNADAVSCVSVTAAATGNAPIIEPRGAATNINLAIRGKGTGRVSIGPYTALGGLTPTITGYVEAVDETGASILFFTGTVA